MKQKMVGAILLFLCIGVSAKKEQVIPIPLFAQFAISSSIGKDQTPYHFLFTARGYENQHPIQRYKTQLDSRGLTIQQGSHEWGLQLLGVGDETQIQNLSKAQLEVKANRADYHYNSKVTAWYENGPLGLQQGFTLQSSPKKESGSKLLVKLGELGNLKSELKNNRLLMKDSKGAEVFRYSGLIAFDSRGIKLPANMKLRGRELELEVDDRQAVYPVTIDPFVQSAALTASDGTTNDGFGSSVAIDALTIVVGTPAIGGGGNGAAYVFTQSSGTWSQFQKLTANDGAVGDAFGSSVAISGATILIGAPTATIGSNVGQGAVYVFTLSGTWTQAQKLTASDGAATDSFGSSVAISNSTFVIGANGATVGSNPFQGAAYVFTGTPGSSTQSAKLTSSDGASGDGFGGAVGIDDSTIVIGAQSAPAAGALQGPGSVYVYTESAGSWSQSQELTASDGVASDGFGASVSINGTNLLIGALNHNTTGAAYVFTSSSGTWSQSQKLSPGSGASNFGASVGMGTDTIIVGASASSVGGKTQGAAYVYTSSSGTWSESQTLTSGDGENSGQFGASVAISGSNIVVGANQEDVGSNLEQGTAYVFVNPEVALSTETLSLDAGGSAGSYSVSLNAEPSADVVITITPASGLSLSSSMLAAAIPDLSLSNNTLTFTSSNWFTPQTVEVSAASTASGTLTISHNVSSTDSNYNGLSVPNVVVTVTGGTPNSPPLSGGACMLGRSILYGTELLWWSLAFFLVLWMRQRRVKIF